MSRYNSDATIEESSEELPNTDDSFSAEDSEASVVVNYGKKTSTSKDVIHKDVIPKIPKLQT